MNNSLQRTKRNPLIPYGPHPLFTLGEGNYFDTCPSHESAKKKKQRKMKKAIFEWMESLTVPSHIERYPRSRNADGQATKITPFVEDVCDIQVKYLCYRVRRDDVWGQLNSRGFAYMQHALDHQIQDTLYYDAMHCAEGRHWNRFAHTKGAQFVVLPLCPVSELGAACDSQLEWISLIIGKWIEKSFPHHKWASPYLFSCKQIDTLIIMSLFHWLLSLSLTFLFLGSRFVPTFLAFYFVQCVPTYLAVLCFIHSAHVLSPLLLLFISCNVSPLILLFSASYTRLTFCPHFSCFLFRAMCPHLSCCSLLHTLGSRFVPTFIAFYFVQCVPTYLAVLCFIHSAHVLSPLFLLFISCNVSPLILLFSASYTRLTFCPHFSCFLFRAMCPHLSCCSLLHTLGSRFVPTFLAFYFMQCVPTFLAASFFTLHTLDSHVVPTFLAILSCTSSPINVLFLSFRAFRSSQRQGSWIPP